MTAAHDTRALAASLLAQGDLPEAAAAAHAAVALAPDDHDAWVILGTALAKQNQHEKAVPCFERAAALDPKDIASLTTLGEVLLELGAYTQASRALAQAMALDPDAADPFGRRARALVASTLQKLKT